MESEKQVTTGRKIEETGAVLVDLIMGVSELAGGIVHAAREADSFEEMKEAILMLPNQCPFLTQIINEVTKAGKEAQARREAGDGGR